MKVEELEQRYSEFGEKYYGNRETIDFDELKKLSFDITKMKIKVNQESNTANYDLQDAKTIARLDIINKLNEEGKTELAKTIDAMVENKCIEQKRIHRIKHDMYFSLSILDCSVKCMIEQIYNEFRIVNEDIANEDE